MKISFVIPAYNEAEGIARCVSSITAHIPDFMDHEIIVVDNGSEDDTASIAAQAGARVVPSEAATIGGVRNTGASASKGDVLVFLDADCAITSDWTPGFVKLITDPSTPELWCAGSQVVPPPGEPVFLWKYWFSPFVTQQTASHVGSAHMILRRDDFARIGGFDDALATGEDFELCSRVRHAGGRILNLPHMRVEHYGFPKTWSSFFQRERWHGAGDAGSIRSVLTSRVAIASLLFVTLSTLSILALVVGHHGVGYSSLGGAFALLLVVSAVKFGHAGVRVQMASLAILPVYFLARATSVIDAWWRPGRRSQGPRLSVQ